MGGHTWTEVVCEGRLQRVFIDEMKEDGSEKWNKVKEHNLN